MPRNAREIRLAYWTSDSEWYVELNGRRIALLTDVRFEEMFWVNCKIESLSSDQADIEAFFHTGTSCQFVHVKTGLVAEAITSGRYTDVDELQKHRASGRVVVRGLYVNMAPLTPWEKFLLFRRRSRHFG